MTSFFLESVLFFHFFLFFLLSLGEHLTRRLFSRWRSINFEWYLFFRKVISKNEVSQMYVKPIIVTSFVPIFYSSYLSETWFAQKPETICLIIIRQTFCVLKQFSLLFLYKVCVNCWYLAFIKNMHYFM